MGKQSNQPTFVSQEQFDKDLDNSLNILIQDGADDATIEHYIDDYKSRFSVKKKGDTTSTSTTKIPNTESAQKNGSSASQEFEWKPKIDAKTGKEVYYTDKSGNLVPAQEKVLKGHATEREVALIQKEELKQKASKPYKPSVNYTKYKEETGISQEEKDKASSEIDAEINNEGVLNKIGGAFRWMGDVLENKINPLLGKDINPNLGQAYSEERKQAVELLKKELKVESPDQINPKLILEKTKELALDKKVESIKINKNNEFLSKLSDADKKALEIEKVQHYKTLSDKDKYIMTEGALLNNEIEKISKEGVVVKKILEDFVNKGQELPDNLVQHAVDLEENFKNKISELDKLGNSYKENVSEIGSVEEEIDFLKRNYSVLDKVKTSAKLGTADLYVNLSKGLPLLIDDLNNNNLSPEDRESLIDDLIDWENAKNLERSKHKKDVSFENLSFKNFGEFFAQEIGTQLPIFAQIALPGGIPSMFVTSSANKYGEMEKESNKISFEYNGQEFSGFEKEGGSVVDSSGREFDSKDVKITSFRKPDYSKSQMIATAVGFGLAETVLGSLPTKNIMGRAVSSFEKSGQRTLLREGIKNYTLKKGKKIIADTSLEASSEGLTQLVQNFLDIKVLDKGDVKLFDGVGHASFSGGMFGFGMASVPAIVGVAMRPFSDNKSGKAVRENMENIFRLQEELNKPNVSEAVREAINNKIKEYETQNKTILTSVAKRTENMPKEIVEKIISVTNKQELLTLQATEIKEDASLSPELKKELIQGLEFEYNTLEKKRADLVSDKATVLDALSDSEKQKLKDKAGKQLIKEAEESGKKEASFNDEQITKRAVEIYEAKKAEKITKEPPVVEKTTADTKEQVKETESAPSVSLKEEVKDETTQGEDIVADGNIQPRVEPMGEVAESKPTTTETIAEESISDTNESKPSKGVNEVKISKNGQTYNVEKNDLGEIVVTNKKGEKPSNKTVAKVLNEFSKNIDFTKGDKVSDTNETSAETYLDDVAEKSKNASEIAEAIAFAQTQDFNENRNPIDLAIARVLGEKSVERSSFTQEGDRNTINASIGLQYFAKKGEGRGLDQIAMDVEYEIYGDYDAVNPRVTTQDIVDFIVSNPGGTQKFLSENKNAKIDALKTAFTDVTGLPANDNFVQKALKQDAENSSRMYNEEILYALSTDELIKLEEEYNQFKQYENEQKRNDTSNERSVDSKNKEKRIEERKVQEPRRESVDKKQEVKERIAERIKAKNAQIDDLANTIKGIDNIFGFKIKADNIEGLDKQGVDVIAVIASIVKQAVEAGIHIDEAIKKTIEHFSKTYDLEPDTIDRVKEKLNPKKEPIKKNDNQSSFEYNASFVPESDVLGEYLSADTTEKYTEEEVEIDKTIRKIKLTEALRHGVNTIELAKVQFGDDFVAKTLEFLENANIPQHAKALVYVSLSNELDRQRKEFPEDRSRIQKQINLVDKKRMAFARQTALASNMGRLQAFAKIGYDTNEIKDRMFSSAEKTNRRKIEKLVEASMDEINNEEVNQDDDFNADFVMSEPKSKKTKEDAKKDLNDALKALKLDWNKLSRGGTLNATIPGYKQVEVATPHIFKIAKAMIEIGGYTTAEIIENIYNNLGNAFPAIKKKDISDVLRSKYDKENKSKEPKTKKANQIVKDLLIEAGYSRTANVTVNKRDAEGNNVLDEKGNVVKVKENRTYLDWKKLAGEEGSVDNMKEKVAKVLKRKGYTDAQIKETNDSLKEEFDALRASVIEKGIREINNRNKVKPSVNIKATARKLAELYNYGIFEENVANYNLLLNSALGFSEFQQKTYEELEGYAKALAKLHASDSMFIEDQKMSDIALKTTTAIINQNIKQVISRASFISGTLGFKAVNVLSDYTNLSQLSKLMSALQAIENPFSGFTERMFQLIGEKLFKTTDTGNLRADRKELAKFVYKDIVRNGALHYGDVSTTLVNKSKVEDWLNNQSDNQLYHTVISSLTARAYLNGADSFNKALITEKMFAQNIIKMLTSDSNPNGKMSLSEALEFVSESLTGQNKKDALETAKEIIKKANEASGKQVIPETEATYFRFAQDIVKESLVIGGKVTVENVTDAYNAGYKSAGFSLGHEANNFLSKAVGSANARIDVSLEKAVKEKKWNEAIALTLEAIVVKNILNPFVGGGSNWVVLTASKAGVNPVSMYLDWASKKDNPLDMTTEQGVKNIKNALVRDTNFKKTAARNLIGAGLSISIAATMIASGADDDLDDWLKKNKWSKRYFGRLSPPVVASIIAYKNDELGKYLMGTLNMKTDQMDEFMKTLKTLQNDNLSTAGQVGKVSGIAFDTPLPWRFVRDIQNLNRAVKGLPEIKSDYEKSSYWNGYYQGGFVDYIGFRPEVNYELVQKIQVAKEEAKDHADKVGSIADKYDEGKLTFNEMKEAIEGVMKEDVDRAEKTIKILKNKIPQNEMKKIKDPFYKKFKRESNPEIKALLFYDKFGDIKNLSPEMMKEMSTNMEIIKYNPDDDFFREYNKVLAESEKPNKE